MKAHHQSGSSGGTGGVQRGASPEFPCPPIFLPSALGPLSHGRSLNRHTPCPPPPWRCASAGEKRVRRARGGKTRGPPAPKNTGRAPRPAPPKKKKTPPRNRRNGERACVTFACSRPFHPGD